VPQARQEKTPGPGQRRARRSSRKRRPSQSPGILRPRAAKSRSSNPLRKSGARLLRFDRRLGARFVAGADEAGRGSLAGPLVVAGVLLDYGRLRDHRVRPLACLNDSKQVAPEEREELFRAVVGCATRISVQVVSPGEIDREGLHRSNLAGLRRALAALAPPAEACLVDGFRLGPRAPEHLAVVDGDEHSAAIAAASIVAKVVRDRYMRRAHALYPAFGFASHVGYITPAHSKVVRERGPSEIHRRSFQALCYLSEEELAALSL
jgi:ribonuclease HII